jgi:hypothetical protein
MDKLVINSSAGTEHPMHSKIFLQHPNLLIQAHLQGNK